MDILLNRLGAVQTSLDVDRCLDELFIELRGTFKGLSYKDLNRLGQVLKLLRTYYEKVFPNFAKRDRLYREILKMLRDVPDEEVNGYFKTAIRFFPPQVLEEYSEIRNNDPEIRFLSIAGRMLETGEKMYQKTIKASYEEEAKQESDRRGNQILELFDNAHFMKHAQEYMPLVEEKLSMKNFTRTQAALNRMNDWIEQIQKEIDEFTTEHNIVLRPRLFTDEMIDEWIGQLDDAKLFTYKTELEQVKEIAGKPIPKPVEVSKVKKYEMLKEDKLKSKELKEELQKTTKQTIIRTKAPKVEVPQINVSVKAVLPNPSSSDETADLALFSPEPAKEPVHIQSDSAFPVRKPTAPHYDAGSVAEEIRKKHKGGSAI